MWETAHREEAQPSTAHRKIAIAQVHSLPMFHRATITREYLDHNGHMNVQWYFALYNDATRNLFVSLGINEAYRVEQEAGIFALKQFIHYLAEVRVDETVAIYIRLLGRSAKRLHAMYFMVNETTGRLSSIMETLSSHVDLRTRRASSFPPHIAATIDAQLYEHQRYEWDMPVSGVMEA